MLDSHVTSVTKIRSMDNCYSKSKRIPREQLHDQEERLSTKHIQTLSFLQDIVNENKSLKERIEELEAKFGECEELHKLAAESKDRIKELQASYLDRADEINAMLIKKHEKELMKQVEEKLEAERRWNDEKRRFKEEIAELERINKEKEKEIDVLRKNERKLQMLTLKLDATLEEVENLKADNDKQKEMNIKQMEEIQRLKLSKERLIDQLAEANQKIKQLEAKTKQLEADLDDVLNDTSKDDTIDSLKRKCSKLQKDKQLWTAKENEYEKSIEDLREQIKQLKTNLASSERNRIHMKGEIDILLEEIERLKRKIGGDRSFKNFVSLKREMLFVKEENDTLKTVLKQPPVLPVLKEDKVARPKSSKGERPKTATRKQ